MYAGLARFLDEVPESELTATLDVAPALKLAMDAMGDREWHPRAQQLVSELLTIGVLSRRHFRHEALNAQDVRRMSESLEGFLNSWFHMSWPTVSSSG